MKTNTMNLPKRLLNAASTEANREALHGALIDAEHRCIVVCNGRILVLHPIPGEAPVKPGYITPAKWKMARALNAKEMAFDFVAGTLNGQLIDAPDANGTYPNYRMIMPDFTSCYSVRIRPDLIDDLAEAMGVGSGDHDGLLFEFDVEAGTPVKVSYKDATAVLMPMSGGSGLAKNDDANKALRQQIADLKKSLSERSDSATVQHPAVASSAADAALIESLKAALHESRAECREATSRMAALERSSATRQPGTTPPVKQLDTKPTGKADPKAPKAPAPPATARPVLTRNAQRDGIELRFNGKPDDATREAMKARNWRWLPGHPGQPWVKKYTEEEYLFAQSLAEGSDFTPMPEDAEPGVPASPAIPPVSEWTRSTILPEQPQPKAPTPLTPAAPSRVRRITLPEF